MKNIDELNNEIKKLDQEIYEITQMIIDNINLGVASQEDKCKYDMLNQLINELEKERDSKINEVLKLYGYKK